MIMTAWHFFFYLLSLMIFICEDILMSGEHKSGLVKLSCSSKTSGLLK